MRTGILRVWQRTLTVYRQNWKISFLPPILEPLLYLTAFGICTARQICLKALF